MEVRAKFVASVWLLFGAVTSVLLAQDLARVAGELQRDATVALVAVPFVAFCAACLSLSFGLFTGRAFSARLGLALSLVVGVLLFAYVGLNLFMLLRASLLVSFLACTGGLLGIWFCWLTFKVSRRREP